MKKTKEKKQNKNSDSFIVAFTLKALFCLCTNCVRAQEWLQKSEREQRAAGIKSQRWVLTSDSSLRGISCSN